MTNIKITNEELFSKMEAMEDRSLIHREYTKETLEAIKEQTIKTNGRVDKHHDEIRLLCKFKDRSDGMIKMLMLILLFAGFMIGTAASYYAGWWSREPQKIEINNNQQPKTNQ